MFTIINVSGDNTNPTLNEKELAAFNAGTAVIKMQDVVIKDNGPQLSLLYISKNTDPRNTIDPPVVIRHVWLTPFRGYKFQVSATINGEDDLGSTLVVGLGNIIEAMNAYPGNPTSKSSIYASNYKMPDITHQIFDAMAKSAIMEFQMNANWRLRGSREPSTPYMCLSYDDDRNLSIFIRLCIEYVINYGVKTPTVDEMGSRFGVHLDGIWIKNIEGDDLKDFLSNQKASFTSQTLEANN